MSDRVRGCVLLDSPDRIDVSAALNAEEAVCPPLLLAALGVAESTPPGKPKGLYERTIGDAHTLLGSHGLFQINPQYHTAHSAEWYRVAEYAIRYAAPIMGRNLAQAGGDWVRAMGLWNKPNGSASLTVLGNYAAGLQFAREHYAIKEEPMIDLKPPKREDFPPRQFTSFTEIAAYLAEEEWKKSFNEYVDAQLAQGNAQAACDALIELNPVRFKGLSPKA